VLRRTIFVILDLFLAVTPSLKYMLFSWLHILSLSSHLLAKPYTRQLFNHAETITLVILSILGVCMAAFPNPHTRGSNDEVAEMTLQLLITILVMLPIVVALLYAVYQGIIKCVHRNHSHHSQEDDEHSNDISMKQYSMLPSID
jgi:cytochrome bd-type quinol oxidase subunit 2